MVWTGSIMGPTGSSHGVCGVSRLRSYAKNLKELDRSRSPHPFRPWSQEVLPDGDQEMATLWPPHSLLSMYKDLQR